MTKIELNVFRSVLESRQTDLRDGSRSREALAIETSPGVRMSWTESSTPAVAIGHSRGNDALTEDEQTRLFGFRAAHVFDVSQTDGEPLPEFATVKGEPRGYADRLARFVASQGIALAYDSKIAPAKGLSSGGKITLLTDMPSAEHFAVLTHEAAHELLHRGDRRKETTHTIRETEAEAVAFVVCSAIGLDANTSSSDYIQLHAGDKATLAESLAFIQQTASVILQAIEPQEAAKANSQP
jgi:hypothetical protein